MKDCRLITYWPARSMLEEIRDAHRPSNEGGTGRGGTRIGRGGTRDKLLNQHTSIALRVARLLALCIASRQGARSVSHRVMQALCRLFAGFMQAFF